MEDNRKIAEFLGWRGIWQGNVSLVGVPPWSATEEDIPDYTTSDADAVSLLSVLVEKGYWYDMKNLAPNWTEFLIYWDVMDKPVASGTKQSIAAAITAAVLELIAKEQP